MLLKFLYWLAEQTCLTEIILVEDVPLCLKYMYNDEIKLNIHSVSHNNINILLCKTEYIILLC